jgi:Zn-dependent protease with chaperone function
MSTSFFQRQETARANTWWLIFLFIIAVIGIVATASVVGFVIADVAATSVPTEGSPVGPGSDGPQSVDPVGVAVLCGIVAGGVILLGTVYQVIALRSGGGSGVAESVGGRPLVVDTASPDEKRLLNIVEEMAIASGTPVPPVYILDEPGINAFAAGYRPNDAVLGVTRGAIENLNREQLQGVIAHEFSHVLNGDMKMNIRMIGILHGILLLSLIGRFMFQSLRFMGGSRSSDDKGRAGIVILLVIGGLAMMIIGSIGSFIGGLIKAAVSREREYLADASAVQFTRNPDGIGGALKRIAAITTHGRLEHPNASVASHLYFAQGVYEGLTGLLATHPPLEKRILAIEPTWDGSLESRPASAPTRHTGAKSAAVSSLADAASAGPAMMGSGLLKTGAAVGFASAPIQANQQVSAAMLRDATEHVGAPEEEHYEYSAALLHNMHPELRKAASEPYSARSLIFALLLDRERSIAQKQIADLRTTIAPPIVELTLRLAPLVQEAAEASRLPLVDLALPMLRRMSSSQYEQFTRAFEGLVRADNRLSIFEWTLAQVLRRNLRSQYQPVSGVAIVYYRLSKLSEEVSVLLSMLARVGHVEAEMPMAIDAGAKKLPGVNVRLISADQCSFAVLETALNKLRRASEHRRIELLDACAAAVAADGLVMVREAELLRGIADLLECPMPPIINAKRVI